MYCCQLVEKQNSEESEKVDNAGSSTAEEQKCTTPPALESTPTNNETEEKCGDETTPPVTESQEPNKENHSDSSPQNETTPVESKTVSPVETPTETGASLSGPTDISTDPSLSPRIGLVAEQKPVEENDSAKSAIPMEIDQPDSNSVEKASDTVNGDLSTTPPEDIVDKPQEKATTDSNTTTQAKSPDGGVTTGNSVLPLPDKNAEGGKDDDQVWCKFSFYMF